MAKRNTGDKTEVPGTVIPEGDTVSAVSVGDKTADPLAWLAAAGVDTKAIKAEWKAAENKGEHARAAFIGRMRDQHGLRVLLMKHAEACLEKAIA